MHTFLKFAGAIITVMWTLVIASMAYEMAYLDTTLGGLVPMVMLTAGPMVGYVLRICGED